MSDPETDGRETADQTARGINRAETTVGERHGGNAEAARRRIVNAANRVGDSVERKNTYAYKNVDYDKEIRVLKIFPGSPGTPIACRLVRCTLLDSRGRPYLDHSEPVPYSALSYYWGDDKPKNRVYLFDTEEAYQDWKGKKNSLRSLVGKLHIQNNLKAALEQLRSEHEPVCLWADALCINQKNIKERTAQVARMHEVYTQAQKVFIWLGEGKPEENRKTFEFLNKILDLEKLEQLVDRLAKKDDEPSWREDLQDCKRAIDLMKADWFSRRWVIQELALATNAHVRRGNYEMSWQEFADAIALFMTKYDQIRRAFESPKDYSASRNSDDRHIMALDAKALGANALVTATSNLFRRSNEGRIQQRLLSLEVLVSSMLLAFEATDPKDTVFAVLQIAKDNPVADTFIDTMSSSNNTALLYGRYVIPVIFGILWKVDVMTLLHSSRRTSTSDISIRYTALGPRIGMSVLINYCILVLGILVISMVCAMLLDTIVKWYKHIRNGTRGNGSQIIKALDKRIEPNYQKCLMDVCADFIEYCIEDSKSLDVLCRHWAPQPKPNEQSQVIDMPSWILSIEGHAFGGPKQLHKGRINGDSFVGSSERRSHYTASGNLQPSVKFGKTKAAQEFVAEEIKQEPGVYTTLTPQGKMELPPRFDGILEIKGFQLDVIEESAPVIGHVISRRALELCGWSKEIGTTDMDQVWRILVANRGPDGTNAPNWYRRACKACLEWYNMQAEDPFNTDYLKNMKGTPSGKVEFLDRMQQVIYSRNVVRTGGQTRRNYIGITPRKSQIYDIICILYGCSVPVVLRQVQGTGNYTFIGECYVHGAMDGEAVDPMPNGVKEQWFKLQ